MPHGTLDDGTIKLGAVAAWKRNDYVAKGDALMRTVNARLEKGGKKPILNYVKGGGAGQNMQSLLDIPGGVGGGGLRHIPLTSDTLKRFSIKTPPTITVQSFGNCVDKLIEKAVRAGDMALIIASEAAYALQKLTKAFDQLAADEACSHVGARAAIDACVLLTRAGIAMSA